MLLRSVFIVLVLVMLTGCSSVVTQHPIGAAPEEPLDELSGLWAVDDGVVAVQALPGGKLALAGVEWKADQTEFVVDRAEALVTRDEGVLFLHVRQPDDAAEGWFFLHAAVSTDGRSAVLHLPKVEAFAQAVRDRALTGEIEASPEGQTRRVTLTGDAGELTRFVTPDDVARLFDLSKPLVLRKLPAGD